MFLVGMLLFSGYGTLVPAEVRCAWPGAVGCPGGVLGPQAGPAATANSQFFNITMFDYGFWIIDTVSGANETKAWNVYEGWTVHVNATSAKADASVGGTAYHGIGVEINATGSQLLQLSAGVGKWASASFVAPSHAYYHQHIWCTVYCGQGHDGMQNHVLNVVPSTIVPTVSVKGTPTNGTAPLSVTFTGSVTGGTAPVKTAWNFGDGSVLNGTVNTTHIYTLSGSYTAVLTATDANGYQATGSVPVTVGSTAPLVARATVTPSTGVVPFVAQLAASSSGGTGGVSYAWDLGDGASAAGATATHVYSAPGQYVLTLTATDSSGASVTVVTNVTARGPAGALTVAATATPSTAAAPASVNFSAQASGATSPVSVLWEFGDGVVSSSSSLTIAHLYSVPGAYEAAVFVTDAAGLVGHAFVLENVTGTTTSPLAARLVVDPTAGAPPLSIAAAVSIEGGSGSYVGSSWSFGDGTSGAGSLASHTYGQLGSYNLSVTVSDSTGAKATATTSVKVEGLQLSVSSNATIGDAPLSVRVGASVVGGTGTYGPISWAWGDGSSSTGSPANHTYAANLSGSFDIIGTVTDSGGATARGNLTVTILLPPTANLSVQIENVAYPPTNATFTLNVTGGSGIYSTEPLWDFGDGTTTRGPSPQNHTYHKPGRFLVDVLTNDSFGRASNASLSVTISGGAAASGGAGGGGGAWTFTGVADPNSAALGLLGFIAVSGLAVLYVKRPTAPSVRPAVPKSRSAAPVRTGLPAAPPPQDPEV